MSSSQHANSEHSATPVLVTGSAGFIGFHVAKQLLDQGRSVVGVDNLNEYYDVNLKNARNAELNKRDGFTFVKGDLGDAGLVNELFEKYGFRRVVHLAAQPGVRYSIDHPEKYIQANVIAFFNVLEACRQSKVEHLVFASSSSVYGMNTKQPFSVHDNVDHPISLYAATKKSNELIAHSYAHLFGLPLTGLRFFTVYGPWGRPDMAPIKFCTSIRDGKPLKLFNYGNMDRDFTFVDDIAGGTVAVLDHIPEPNQQWNSDDPDPGSSPAPYRVFNIGAGRPVNLKRFLELLEQAMDKKAIVELTEMQPGDVKSTFASVEDLTREVGYKPRVSLEDGIPQFVNWFKEYYGEKAGASTQK
jgi:UDP-glucuronate 4-epimerase